MENVCTRSRSGSSSDSDNGVSASRNSQRRRLSSSPKSNSHVYKPSSEEWVPLPSGESSTRDNKWSSFKSCASPYSEKRSTSPYTEKRRTSSYTGKRRTSPYTEKRRTSQYTEKRRTSSYSEKRRTSPFPEKKRTSPFPEKRRSSPFSEKRRTSPFSEKKRTSQFSEKKRTSPFSEKRRTSPFLEKMRTSPYSRKRRTSPYSGKRRTSPYSEKRRSSPYSEKRRSSPYSEKRRSSPYTEKRSSSPYTEKRSTSPYTEKRSTSPYTEKKRTSPYSEKRRTSPYPEKKRTSPYSEKRSTSPYTEKISTSPFRERKVTFSLDQSTLSTNGSGSTNDDETVRDQRFSRSTHRSKTFQDSLRVKVTVSRKRSLSSSSSDELLLKSSDADSDDLPSKRRRLNDNKASQENSTNRRTSETVIRQAVRSYAVVPAASTFLRISGNTQSGVSQTGDLKAEDVSSAKREKPARIILLGQNSSKHYDGSTGKYDVMSENGQAKGTGFKMSPITPAMTQRIGASSDFCCHSTNFLKSGTTPKQHTENSPRYRSPSTFSYSSPRYGSPSVANYQSPRYGSPSVANYPSPRYGSPSFANHQSPRSTLRGLDQPQPWARDLVARSETYSSTFIDTHCHIDLLYDRLAICHSTKFGDFQKMVASSFPTNFEGCVAVFCYPKTYDPDNPQDTVLQTLSGEDNIWFALGCHPKNALEFTHRHTQSLRSALEHPKVVALGEIGLDYSGTFYQHAETQKKVLRQQLQMAVDLQLPLVIHCRDAYDDCLAILIEMVPRSWRIHLHCFCGNLDTAALWLDTFPNLYIGLTPVITYKTAHGPISTARNIPLDRILLETDSPYFVPGSIKGKVSVSHPGFALFTAERIAELKNVPVNTVLLTCRTNSRLMYGI